MNIEIVWIYDSYHCSALLFESYVWGSEVPYIPQIGSDCSGLSVSNSTVCGAQNLKLIDERCNRGTREHQDESESDIGSTFSILISKK